MLTYWLYRSVACIPSRSTDEAMIYLRSRQRNIECGISGFLQREGSHFVQYLEGADDQVAHIKRLIQADWRHRDVQTLSEGPLQTRRFDGWDMALTETETGFFGVFQRIHGRSADLSTARTEEFVAFLDHLSSSGKGQRDDPAWNAEIPNAASPAFRETANSTEGRSAS
ncbi:Blue light- and temperature-regulated antirepressor YcgF [Rhodobacteraceae bacterium THAF1]|uniref:BLUF domain-containing protein n=1 Tax=Palleronia sp. THAF1 TaxID=2587842 RepID=UPI000F3F3B2F|nr:BLUF domain-containing protein [Palleronia sp. THAF1]QFU10175.1 Blue light- and temperature-regulated antirepressor YcgF [Palleronia sp. THAF1]VDC16920.1 Blue light- and temperature-regulated antirepressor YcgF [Rhodobacteraceae bacterium THAF1]